ncbi:hypothetical protein CCACVL1_13404 [Corchorus capsularis]|uniref:Uncharacterized protein n=1 Tax=Corchorus capsularis TaxID=210143 RepID=A0A1R3IB51_COCAP|nr:hypothetical protein CCACVL1_13404 [Corchorus capsularis]
MAAIMFIQSQKSFIVGILTSKTASFLHLND